MQVLAWGTYDLSKPRVRILLRALRGVADVELRECHQDVWGGMADKSQLHGLGKKMRIVLRWLFAYPRLIWCLFRQPRPDVIFVGYLGQFDVLLLWPFARLRGIPIVWDAFISLYNTVVEDRRIVGRRHPLALLLYGTEWLATRAADLVLLDTRAHANYFVETFGIHADKTAAVFVGVEPEVFSHDAPRDKPATPYSVLFYGQFTPLHGIEVIVQAARILKNTSVHWILIGKGQEERKITTLLEEQPLPQVNWIPWVEYEDLIAWIAHADLCLGIFDSGGKASRVIPNKVFQILEAGKPLITRDSPAIRELISPHEEGVILVPPDDPAALATAVLRMRDAAGPANGLHYSIRQKFTIPEIGKALVQILSRLQRPAATLN